MPTPLWVKGKSGNPAGRPKDPPELHKMKLLTRADFARVVTQFMGMSKEEMKAYSNKPEATMLELMVLSVMMKAVAGGDDKRLNFLLDRLVGKVTDKVQIAGYDGGALKVRREVDLKSLSAEELAIIEKALGNAAGETPSGD